MPQGPCSSWICYDKDGKVEYNENFENDKVIKHEIRENTAKKH